ncbi:hypothetical protein C8J56DRAFT_1066023 [Mycena floridula]|nr:hypothetical protein C8J56DRAFT_1066023 [Mycena floridula]
MVNPEGSNGHANGARPADDVLGPVLCQYGIEQIPLKNRIQLLEKMYGYTRKLTTLKKLNKQFNVPTSKKPPAMHIATGLITEKMVANVSCQNGPVTVQKQIALEHGIIIPRDTCRNIMLANDPDGAEVRYPGRKNAKKVRGHLTGIGVLQEVHADGHEELNWKALRMGMVSLDIYGIRDHCSGRILMNDVVLNAHCRFTVGHLYLDLVERLGYVITVQVTVDCGVEIGEMFAEHCALRREYSPLMEGVPAVRALKSSDNIPIESSWQYMSKHIGHDMKEIIMLGQSQGYFIPAIQLHVDLFNWLWPKIVQQCLDLWRTYWNSHTVRSQPDKVLPSGDSPDLIYQLPENHGLINCSIPVTKAAIDILRADLGKSQAECMRWVSEEFEARADEAYMSIGSPTLRLIEGWTIYTRMLKLLE